MKKHIIIAIIFVAFGIFALWNDIPAYFESGKYLYQLPIAIIWNAKFEFLFSIIITLGVFTHCKKNS